MESLQNSFEAFVDAAGDVIWSFPEELPWLVVLLIGTGVFLTLRMAFIQFRSFRHAVQVVRGKFDDPSHEGDISHFQALTTALSATVGIGNIAGVATAIHFGGPGAVFWMWVTALLGMCTKYVEVALAMKYRDFDAVGNSSGGPQKYITKGLGRRWKPLAVFFALCAIVSSLGAGNMNQINTLADAVHATTGIEYWISGAVCAVLVGSVILGGITRIGRVTSILMPLMAVVYVVGALIVLVLNASELPGAFGAIFSNAFDPTSGVAGTAAGVWSYTLLWGVKRGLFSNEAGQGSAPIAHAAAKTNQPLREGLVALLGPFIDTLCICTMTALVIITAGYWDKPLDETHSLAHKDLMVMTWSEGSTLQAGDGGPDGSMAAFGLAAGRREAPASIEEAGYSGPADDGSLEGATPVDETLIIRDGLPAGVRHDDGTVTGAVLVKNEAPVLIPSGERILAEDGRPLEGDLELTVNGGRITDAAAEHLTIRARMLKTGQDLTAQSFEGTLGGLGRFIVTLTVILFAISTAISWSYYGDRCAEFLLGIRATYVYRVIFLGFIYLGAVLPLQVVWDFGDVALGAMTIPNLIAVLFLSGQVRRMQDGYFSQEHRPTR